MYVKGEIVLIDRDEFETDFFKEILFRMNLSVTIRHFKTPIDGLYYLKNTTQKIFVVISLIDFGPAHMTGLELKRAINRHEDLLLKAVPFVFMTYLDDKQTIEAAYKLNIQGYFKKPDNLEGSTELLTSICNYWALNLRPDEA